MPQFRIPRKLPLSFCLALALVLALVPGPARAQAAGAEKVIGMYVHQHWPYNHPYSARTWSVEDWEGYLDGLHRLGFNMVLIWPVLETMPNPMTESDLACLDKIQKVIDLAKNGLGMRVYIALGPNVGAVDDVANRFTFENRHFFYCDRRIDPGNPGEVEAMLNFRGEQFKWLANTDGVMIIDSDPGGFPGSTNREYVDLLSAYRKMLDAVRPGIELVYWQHAGWPRYSRFYETSLFGPAVPDEQREAIRLLKEANPEPWGLANGMEYAKELGVEDRVIGFVYGRIESEPSFPITEYWPDRAMAGGTAKAARGVLGNAQSHCLQLANTFAFVRGAQGKTANDEEYVAFAEELLPGHGALIARAWKLFAAKDSGGMRETAQELKALEGTPLNTGPLKGLLFGDGQRFIRDLEVQLRFKAALLDFCAALPNSEEAWEKFARFVACADEWQNIHGYENRWKTPELLEALGTLEAPTLQAHLKTMNQALNQELGGEPPYNRVKFRYAWGETETPTLIAAMKRALEETGHMQP